MSEFIDNNSLRKQRLLELALGILDGQRNADFVKQFDNYIEQATPRDMIFIVDGMVKTGAEMEVLKKAVSQVINLSYSSLKPENRRDWSKCTFLHLMVKENEEMELRMKAMKQLVKSINIKDIDPEQFQQIKSDIRSLLSELVAFDVHYQRKENLLFPYLEKKWTDFGCLQVMWSLHDDVRVGLKVLDELLAEEEMNLDEFNYAIGTLYFSVYPLIYREENILFPVAFEELDKGSWDEMLMQSDDYGYVFIDPPENQQDQGQKKTRRKKTPDGFINFPTGKINLEQIEKIFDHLPVDITFVDDQDEVRYFNSAKNRHFPRSTAIIGRKVQNCHPPESIDIVTQIIESFRDGSRDEEAFWINMKGKFIHIRYFAVRDDAGNYMGSIELSQDITQIKKLEGEKRLIENNN